MSAHSVAWRAPGRVNLIGEHTDYNDGFALPLAIQSGCSATVHLVDEPVLRLRSAQEQDSVQTMLSDLQPGSVPGWAAYPAGVVWALRRGRASEPEERGLDIFVDGDVPLGAGLSSSAALSCSTAAAVSDLLDARLDKAELVALARTAENDFVGAPTGGMDQLASVCATEGNVLLCDMQTMAVEQVPFDLAGAGLRLMVIDTRAPHRHSDGEYGARRRSCERAAQLLGVPSLRAVQDDDHVEVLRRLADAARQAGESDVDVLVRRVRHVLSENDRVLQVVASLRAGDVAGIGELLNRSHASMRDDFEITVSEVDTAQRASVDSGALGARMTGGGFGGCVIALTPDRLVPAVTGAVIGAFEAAGFGVPHVFEVRPGQGVHPL